MMVQFCSNSVTGTMIAPALALVWVSLRVSWVMAAHCRFFRARQVKDSRIGPGTLLLGNSSHVSRSAFGFLAVARSELLQGKHFAHPLPFRLCRKTAPERTGRDVLIDGRAPRQHRSLAHRNMLDDSGAPSKDDVLPDRHAAAWSRVRANAAVAAGRAAA